MEIEIKNSNVFCGNEKYSQNDLIEQCIQYIDKKTTTQMQQTKNIFKFLGWYFGITGIIIIQLFKMGVI